MDREKAKMIRSELDKALATVGEKHGITFSLGNITFTDVDFNVKLRGIDSNGAPAVNALELDWIQKKWKYRELDNVELGDIFSNDKGEKFKVAGLKPRNRKYPVIAERLDDGKMFKFSAYVVAVYTGNLPR